MFIEQLITIGSFSTVLIWLSMILLMGILPWHISRRTLIDDDNKEYGTRLQVYATFWRLNLERLQQGQNNWRFSMPLIQQLGSFARTVVKTMAKNSKSIIQAILKALLEKSE